MKFSTLSTTDRVYLDHNATTPLATQVAERVPQWLENWGNPGSIHQSGRGPKTILRDARNSVAHMLGASNLEIVFTSGGSEANNAAIKGVFESYQKASLIPRKFRNRYLFSDVEHPSVRRTAEYLRERGAEIALISVNRQGAIDLESYAKLLDEDTALVSVMLANNETGNIYPVKQMAELAHEKGALFHSDCVQALGKINVNVRDLGVDLASFSGHKFYAMRGSGFLFIRKSVQIESLIHGGGQERHRRGGTENVVAIASLGAMCEMKDEIAVRGAALGTLRDHMESRILSEIENATVTGFESPRIPNTSSLVILGLDGETLLMNLDMKGYSVSTGAACSSGSPEPSPVLLAMGLSRAEAQASLRLGLGWGTSRDEVDLFVDTLKSVVAHLRSFNRMERESHVRL
jgi:cysteine desulfurase